MRVLVFAVVLGLIACGASSAQLPAQKGVPGKGQRPTTAPKGKTSAAEPRKARAMKLTPRSGGAPRVLPVVDEASYLIGIRGYSTGDGVAVESTVSGQDQNQGGRLRCPVEEIMADLQGTGRPIKVKLEPGDVISAVGGYKVTDIEQLVGAVNSASDPHALEITFIDWRTGNEYTGTINAMKLK